MNKHCCNFLVDFHSINIFINVLFVETKLPECNSKQCDRNIFISKDPLSPKQSYHDKRTRKTENFYFPNPRPIVLKWFRVQALLDLLYFSCPIKWLKRQFNLHSIFTVDSMHSKAIYTFIDGIHYKIVLCLQRLKSINFPLF